MINSKNIDWDGFSGDDVQKFLKKWLNEVETGLGVKAGDFYLDEERGVYLVFADEDAREDYLANPEINEHLLLAQIKAGGGGATGDRIKVNLISDYYMSLLPSQKGIYIEFSFETFNADNMQTAEEVKATFTFRWNSVVKTLTQRYQPNSRVRLAIDDYIGESGITNISIRLEALDSLATNTFSVVANRVDLSLSDSYNVGTVYNLIENPQATAQIPFSVRGAGLKTMEWFLDGLPIQADRSEDEVTDASASRVKYIDVSSLSEGIHTVQFRAYITVNGERFYSQTCLRQLIIYRGENPNTHFIALGADLASGTLNESSSIRLNNLTQYIAYTIKIGLFDPQYAAEVPVTVSLDNDVVGTLGLSNGTGRDFTFTPMVGGSHRITVASALKSVTADADIAASSNSLSEINSGLALSLRATGKSNSSPDRDVWTYGSIRSTFAGFNWNPLSGWADGRLMISEGARLEVGYAPLSSDSTATGKTIELEFSAENVVDDDAVICSLLNGNTGLLVTASEVSMTSAAGTKVSARYKAGETVRVAIVINRASGVSDRQLVFIYLDGILSGAAVYAASDNFRVLDNLVFQGSANATLALKDIRIYDVALTADQILNNFILYRDSAGEMLQVYDRNDIFSEGTTDFSTDILGRQLPIMIVTGDIPALEATTNKNLQITVDIEYTDQQNPELSFKMEKAAMRPQGTSSMGYPKKNFRIYSDSLSDTRLYNSEGQEVTPRKYAFRKGAQPVSCWCLKADYAESSGTHNTGVARLWNDVMFNAEIDGQHPLRTKAQEAALSASYPYDVRTTIDGFPILLFYRASAGAPLVFIGKYNFNNDKSTESVFGFKDIPGFSNSKVECWEVLNNGHHLALFTDTSNWNSEWADAFEGRYPDGNTNTAALKSFAEWMASVSSANFSSQKYDHLDVYKVAAYYVYLMRFGAVDQVVKNAMFTTEDGVHWFFINYDNDTVNGLRNDGLLIYPPTIDRQSRDDSFGSEVYAYAGHDSRLWNMLEADSNFMEIVAKVDNALYTAGLTYAGCVKAFDTDQSSKWCERVYNQDAQYKYVGPYRDNGINNLFMLQGARRSHRRWWLSRRFNLMDGKFVSGAYRDNVFEVKLAGAPIGLRFSIVSGFDMNYGYGVNNVAIESGIHLSPGQSHEFITKSVLNVGDPLRLYTAPNIRKIDISEFLPYLSVVTMSGVYSPEVGTALEELVIKKDGASNSALTELSGISNASKLKKLSLGKLMALNALDLSGNLALTDVDIADTGVTALTLPQGAPVVNLALPASLNILELRDLPKLTATGLSMNGGYSSVTSLIITGCPMIDKKTILDQWMSAKTTANAYCSVELDDVNFENISADYLLKFASFMSVSFSGKASLTSLTSEQASQLLEVFGAGCFNKSAKFYIQAPEGFAGLIGPDSVKSGNRAQYSLLADYDEAVGLTWNISPETEGVQISQNGLLTTKVSLKDASITINVTGRKAGGINTISAQKIVSIKKALDLEEYMVSIEGQVWVNFKGVYEYSLKFPSQTDTSQFTVAWSIENGESRGIKIASSSQKKCTVNVDYKGDTEDTYTVKATIKYAETGDVMFSVSFLVEVVPGEVIITSESNPIIMEAMYLSGVCHNEHYMTKGEAEAVTELEVVKSIFDNIYNAGRDGNDTYSKYIINFNEFEYFINAPYYVHSNIRFNSIIFPQKEITLRSGEFGGSVGANEIKFPNLKKVNFETRVSAFIAARINAEFPVLEEIECSVTATGEFYFNTYPFIKIPMLKRVTNTGSNMLKLINRIEGNSFNSPDILIFDFPLLEQFDCYFAASGRFTGNFINEVRLNLGKVQSLPSRIFSSNVSSPPIQDFRVTANELTGEGQESITVPTLITEINMESVTCRVEGSTSYHKKVYAPRAEVLNFGLGSGVLEFLEADHLNFYSSSRLASPKLHTIKLHTSDASKNTMYVGDTLGSEVPEGTPKMLYLKEGATGYDAEVWNKPPLSDYTKSFTL
ncbi:MAG: hypothetical protein J1E16_05685 [Muribaculaceae bacterium]|nr:hypothetical protein [Muribaculaceae bacterium]